MQKWAISSQPLAKGSGRLSNQADVFIRSDQHQHAPSPGLGPNCKERIAATLGYTIRIMIVY
jgi:hypothetical protein